jgi:tetratricopeptide (TPR) repeat protein
MTGGHAATALVLVGALSTLWAAPAAGQIPQTFTNLQVLPKDISRAELVATMRGFAGALGVRCTHCHVGPDNLEGMDFGTDDKETKRTARVMLRMVRSINSDFLAKLPDDEDKLDVGCATCHRSAKRPPMPLEDLVYSAVVTKDAAAGVDTYEKYRNEFLGSGLYDFRERTLNVVATRLREQKRLAEAKQIFEKNLERFPASSIALTSLGQIAAEQGDTATALRYFNRALETDPSNEFVRGLVAKLKATPAAPQAPPR